MKDINFAGIKKAVWSRWMEIKPMFQKHGDILLLALALAVLSAALIYRIGGKNISQTTAPSIQFSQWWQNDLEKETLRNIVNEFESLHKDIKIVITDRAYEDLRHDLFNPSENNFAGDVLALDPLWIPDLIKNGIIENSYDWVPFISFINVLYYNVEILKEAKFTRPPKNRGEFTNYLRTITSREKNRWGLAVDRNSSRGIYDDVFPWIWAAGQQLIKDGEPAVTSRQIVDSLVYLASLNKEGLILPDSPTGNKLEDFVSGRAAFMIAPSNYIEFIRERMGEEAFGVSSIPTPDNYPGKTFYASAEWTIGVNAASAHKEEALLFAGFIAGKTSMLSEKSHAIPGDGSPPLLLAPIYSKLWDIAIASEAAQDLNGLPWTELEETFKEGLNNLLEEKSSPAETAAIIQKKWEEICSPKQ